MEAHRNWGGEAVLIGGFSLFLGGGSLLIGGTFLLWGVPSVGGSPHLGGVFLYGRGSQKPGSLLLSLGAIPAVWRWEIKGGGGGAFLPGSFFLGGGGFLSTWGVGGVLL